VAPRASRLGRAGKRAVSAIPRRRVGRARVGRARVDGTRISCARISRAGIRHLSIAACSSVDSDAADGEVRAFEHHAAGSPRAAAPLLSPERADLDDLVGAARRDRARCGHRITPGHRSRLHLDRRHVHATSSLGRAASVKAVGRARMRARRPAADDSGQALGAFAYATPVAAVFAGAAAHPTAAAILAIRMHRQATAVAVRGTVVGAAAGSFHALHFSGGAGVATAAAIALGGQNRAAAAATLPADFFAADWRARVATESQRRSPSNPAPDDVPRLQVQQIGSIRLRSPAAPLIRVRIDPRAFDAAIVSPIELVHQKALLGISRRHAQHRGCDQRRCADELSMDRDQRLRVRGRNGASVLQASEPRPEGQIGSDPRRIAEMARGEVASAPEDRHDVIRERNGRAWIEPRVVDGRTAAGHARGDRVRGSRVAVNPRIQRGHGAFELDSTAARGSCHGAAQKKSDLDDCPAPTKGHYGFATFITTPTAPPGSWRIDQ